jgi:integral membrane protein (TIGR01906 family)
MAATAASSAWSDRAAGWLVSLATAVVILFGALLPFFTPAWLDFEQGRASVTAWTGFGEADVHQATDAIVSDLLFGGPFDVAVGGVPVLDEAERSHMRDVRAVIQGFGILALLAVAWLVGTAVRASSPVARSRAWLAARRGTSGLVAVLVVVGVLAIVAFEAVFELFHRIVFPGGNWEFDPRTERLVQLFPEQFWSETSLIYGVVAIASALAVGWYAGGRARMSAAEATA